MADVTESRGTRRSAVEFTNSLQYSTLLIYCFFKPRPATFSSSPDFTLWTLLRRKRPS